MLEGLSLIQAAVLGRTIRRRSGYVINQVRDLAAANPLITMPDCADDPIVQAFQKQVDLVHREAQRAEDLQRHEDAVAEEEYLQFNYFISI